MRHFLLLEVLIALALVALCALPLLQPHFAIAQHKIEAIRSLQLQQQADQLFCTVQEMLYEHEITWMHKGQQPSINLPTMTVETPAGQEAYASKAQLSVALQHRKNSGITYRLLNVDIVLTRAKAHTFHYQIYLEQLAKGV